MRNLRASVAVTLLAIGCGNPTSTVNDPAGAYNAVFGALCQKFVLCGVIGASEEAKCVQGFNAAIGGDGYTLNEAFAAGRISIDGAALNNCLAAAAASRCAGAIAPITSCTQFIVGHVATGGVCKATEECVSGFCDLGSTNAQNGCTGTCKPFSATGSMCMSTRECAASDFCGATSRVCTTRGVDGGPCPELGACQSGLTCVGLGAMAPGTCRSAAALGAACDMLPCGGGLYCDKVSMPHTCKSRVATGTGCVQIDSCVDGAVCSGAPNGVCKAWLDANLACDPALPSVSSACPSDFACDPTLKVCTSKAATVGSDCSTAQCLDAALGTDLYCDKVSNKCAARVPFGMACTPNPSGTDPCVGSVCDAMTHVCTLRCM